MKILHLDIETSPNVVRTWGLFKQNISINQIIKPARILCWSAKWHGEKKMYTSLGDKQGLTQIYDLINEADVVVHYNGQRFDMPRLNQEFLKLGFKPPKPYKQIDLYRVVSKHFDLPSSKLEFVVQYFGLGAKVKHPGMELWNGCEEGNEASWALMFKYNKQDVALLEKLYNHLLGWIDNHPNAGLYVEDLDHPICPNCAGAKLQRRGFCRKDALRYQQFQCQTCGRWPRSRKAEKGNKNVLGRA